MRGESLPIPERNLIPGPAPTSAATITRYLKLMTACTAQDPKCRPTFTKVIDELLELSLGETSLNSAPPVSRAPPPAAAAASVGESSLCVVCMEMPCTVGLVHSSDNA